MQALKKFGEWLLIQLQSLALTIWDILTDFLLFILDSLMMLVTYILQGIQMSLEMLDISQYLSGAPPEVLYGLSQSGIGSALGIVMVCGAIRLSLQLIPFVRLGS